MNTPPTDTTTAVGVQRGDAVMGRVSPTHVPQNYSDHPNAIAETELNPNDLLEMSKISPFLSSNMVGKHSQLSFPLKLHLMLKQVDEDGLDCIVCWQPHGRCFIVKDHEKFSGAIMPRFFRQSKFSSFLRQLNVYGFKRLSSGLDKGAYYHELFLRGKLRLSDQIQRLTVKGKGNQKANSADKEPNFYQMAFVEDSMGAESPKLPKEEPKHVYDHPRNISNTSNSHHGAHHTLKSRRDKMKSSKRSKIKSTPIKTPPTDTTTAVRVQPSDVLMGQTYHIYNQPGNISYPNMINHEAYNALKSMECAALQQWQEHMRVVSIVSASANKKNFHGGMTPLGPTSPSLQDLFSKISPDEQQSGSFSAFRKN